MSIDVTCDCGTKYRVSNARAGRHAKCKRCGQTVRVPALAKDASVDTFLEAFEPSGSMAMGDPLQLAPRRRKTWSAANVESTAMLAAMAGILAFCVLCGIAFMYSVWPNREDSTTPSFEPKRPIAVAAGPSSTATPTQAAPPPPPQDDKPVSVTIATNVHGSTIVVLGHPSSTCLAPATLLGDQLEHTFQMPSSDECEFEVRIGGLARRGKFSGHDARLELTFDAGQIVELCRRATCLVKLPEGGHGSGFLYHDRQTVVTAAHVLVTKDVENVELIFDPAEDEEKYTRARLVHFNAEDDVAILRLPSPVADDRPYLWPADKVLGPGHFVINQHAGTVDQQNPAVVAIGSPRNGDSYDPLFSRETTIVAQGRDQFLIAAELKPGCSGGPVCLSDTGRVAGLVSYKLATPGKYEMDGSTFARSIGLVNDAFNYWDRKSPDAKRRELDRLSESFARRYGYRCALKASYYMCMDSTVYTMCCLEFTADFLNYMDEFDRQQKGKYARVLRGGLKTWQLRVVEKKMAAERKAAVDEYIRDRAPQKAATYREKVTPRLLGNAEKWYQEAMADETLSQAMKEQLKETHECYTYLKDRAEHIDADEKFGSVPLREFMEELRDYGSRATSTAVKANQQALQGLQ
jgi:hypothetical protein